MTQARLTVPAWIACGFAVLCAGSPAQACIWDSDTLRDELHIQGTAEFDLISGQFAHHSEAYYRYRIRHSKAQLEQKPQDADLRNDLAIAHLKLGEFDTALEILTRLLEEDPTRYRTLSNLGVLHKKRGEFKLGAEFTARALEIKPEGHLGLGSHYLRMLEYRGQTGVPSASYLGEDYAEFSLHGSHSKEEHAKRMSMVRADQHFADGVLALGDSLLHRGDLNLAAWAYVRARQLGHANPKAVDGRIGMIVEHWKEAGLADGKAWGNDSASVVAKIDRLLRVGAAWQKQFKLVEAQLIAEAGDETAHTVTFAVVEARLLELGITRYRPTTAAAKPEVGQRRNSDSDELVPFSASPAESARARKATETKEVRRSKGKAN